MPGDRKNVKNKKQLTIRRLKMHKRYLHGTSN